nr:uncharacterized protein LOC111420734 [Onthophagus taurus]
MMVTKGTIFFLLLIIGIVLSSKIETRSCQSCGGECETACRTAYYRICCLNYVKKRSMSQMLPLEMDPSLRLELWLAKSKSSPFYQRSFEETILKQAAEEDQIPS